MPQAGDMPMRSLALVAAFVLWSPAGVCAPPSPIARAAQGDVQCYDPDTAHKTCQSIAIYKVLADGKIENTAIVLVGLTPVVVMRTATLVAIKGDQICGPLKADDIEKATFTIGGAPANPGQTSILRSQMKDSMADLLNSTICTTYVPKGEILIAKETVDGVSQPKLDQPVIWVTQAEAYKVAP
jgi:hypothetical protein